VTSGILSVFVIGSAVCLGYLGAPFIFTLAVAGVGVINYWMLKPSMVVATVQNSGVSKAAVFYILTQWITSALFYGLGFGVASLFS